MNELTRKIYEFAQKTLTPARFAHDVRVMEEAVRIGKTEGADPDRCALAGILHDVAREYTLEQYAALGLTEQPGANDPENAIYDHVLMHGMAAAKIGRETFGIEDEEVLEAAAWHTTGRPGMSTLAQIIFVADYTEPGREGAHFDRVRDVLKKDGVLAACAEEAKLSATYWLSKAGLSADARISPEAMPPNCRFSYETMLWAQEQMKENETGTNLKAPAFIRRDNMNKENSKKYTEIVVAAMEDRKAKDIEVIDISEKTTVTDAFILCSGTSSTHLRGIADEVEEKMKQNGVKPARIEGYDTARWILLDFIDVVVHVFLEEERQFYSLERLWR